MFALLLRQRRRAGGHVCVLAGYELGDKHATVGLRHGRDGREEGERWRGVALLLGQVVVLRGKAFVEYAGAHVGEGRGLCAASLLLWECWGRANAQRLQGVGLVGLRGPVLGLLLLPLLGRGCAEARVRRMLSGNWGRGLAERLGQRAEASSHGDGRQVVPHRQVLVEEVVIGVVVLCVVWEEEERKVKTKPRCQIQIETLSKILWKERTDRLLCQKRFPATSLAAFLLHLELFKT